MVITILYTLDRHHAERPLTSEPCINAEESHSSEIQTALLHPTPPTPPPPPPLIPAAQHHCSESADLFLGWSQEVKDGQSGTASESRAPFRVRPPMCSKTKRCRRLILHQLRRQVEVLAPNTCTVTPLCFVLLHSSIAGRLLLKVSVGSPIKCCFKSHCSAKQLPLCFTVLASFFCLFSPSLFTLLTSCASHTETNRNCPETDFILTTTGC